MAKSSNFSGKGGRGAPIRLSGAGPRKAACLSARDRRRFLDRANLVNEVNTVRRRLLALLANRDLPAEARAFLKQQYRLLHGFTGRGLGLFLHYSRYFLLFNIPAYDYFVSLLRPKTTSPGIFTLMFKCLEKAMFSLRDPEEKFRGWFFPELCPARGGALPRPELPDANVSFFSADGSTPPEDWTQSCSRTVCPSLPVK